MRRLLCSLAASAFLVALCADHRQATAEDVAVELAVIVNAGNSARVNGEDLEALFLRKQRHWGDGEPVIPFNFGPDDPARITFDRAVLGMSPDDAARYWLGQRIRAGPSAPREVGDAALVVKLVASRKPVLPTYRQALIYEAFA